jgi:serpin B
MRLLKTSVVACGFVAAAAFVGTTDAAPRGRGPDVRKVSAPAEDRQAVVDGNLEFALSSFREIAKKPGNVVYSPLSVSAVLSMVTAGARGQTRDQLVGVLGNHLPPQDTDRAFQSVLAELRPHGAGVALEIANGLWLNRDHGPFQPGYVSLLRRHYGAQAKPFTFDTVVRDVNRWCAVRTHGMIPRALESVDATTVALIANVVYLDAKWAVPFPEDATKDETFTRADGSEVIVPMMNREGAVPLFAEFDAAAPEGPPTLRVAELAYKDRDFSMLIVLPGAVGGLGEVEAQLPPERVRSWIVGLDSDVEPVELSLPRFEASATMDLVPTIKALGAVDVFDASGNADLSGVAGAPGELYLGLLMQKAKIVVRERGTKAAAVTIGGMQITSVQPEPVSFRADRPFLYLVLHKPTGTILFMGRVLDPSAPPSAD